MTLNPEPYTLTPEHQTLSQLEPRILSLQHRLPGGQHEISVRGFVTQRLSELRSLYLEWPRSKKGNVLDFKAHIPFQKVHWLL